MDTRNLRIVPITSLVKNPNDKRNRTTPAYRAWVAELAADIKERGIRNALLITPDDVILAGMTRWEAAQLAGLTEVPVNVLDRPLTKGQALRETALENLMRRNYTEVELAEVFAELLAANDWTQAELARDLCPDNPKKMEVKISKTMQVSAKLPPELQALIGSGDGRIPPTSAYQLSRLPSADAMKELADKITAGLLKRDHVEREVNKRLGKRQPKGKPIRGRVGIAQFVIPDSATWESLGEIGSKLLELARRGPKTGVSLAAALPSLLKSA